MLLYIIKSNFMKLLLMSDLHLESFPEFRPEIIEGEKDINLFLAGDICEFRRGKMLLEFLNDMTARFKNVVHVPGNHEYYNGHFMNSYDKFKKIANDKLPENYFLLNNSRIVIDDCNIIGTTLWTDYDRANPIAMWHAQQGLNDYKRIRTGSSYSRAKPIDYLAAHRMATNYLNDTLSMLGDGETNIIITHHAPSSLSVAEEFVGDNLNSAYYSDLSELIYEHKPAIWCHGHCHNNFDYDLYDTRVICNPRGYQMHSNRQDGQQNDNFSLNWYEI